MRATVRHRSAPPKGYRREHLGPAEINGRSCTIRADDEGYPCATFLGGEPKEWDVHYKDHRGVHHWILFLVVPAILVGVVLAQVFLGIAA
jgi:hypothetical protein